MCYDICVDVFLKYLYWKCLYFLYDFECSICIEECIFYVVYVLEYCLFLVDVVDRVIFGNEYVFVVFDYIVCDYVFCFVYVFCVVVNYEVGVFYEFGLL